VTPEQAYEEVVRIAREHALVIGATGGLVQIAHPDLQREEGLYCQVQWMHSKGAHPNNGGCKCKTDGNGACSRNRNDRSTD
jgi:hypothetical protein